MRIRFHDEKHRKMRERRALYRMKYLELLKSKYDPAWRHAYYLDNKKKSHDNTNSWRRAHPEKVSKIALKGYIKTIHKNRERAMSRYRENVEVIHRIKMSPCTDCKVQYNPWVMQFDHRNPEEKSFGISSKLCMNVEKLKLEIQKCDVVCANCHAERTHTQRKQHRITISSGKYVTEAKNA